MRILPWISLLALLSCMKAPDPARAMGPPPEKGPPTLVFQAPEGWEEMPSTQSLLLASWTLPGEGIGNVSWMGNRPEIKQANLQRWIDQFEDRGRSETGALEGLSTHPVTLLEVEGTLAQTRQVGGGDPRVGWALLGAVVDTPEGPVYLKVVGPSEEIQTHREAVLKALRSLDLVKQGK